MGRTPARVGVVTSVLLEHVDTLGPTIDDIAGDKFSVADGSDIVIASAQSSRHAPPGTARKLETVTAQPASDGPDWIGECRALAQRAAERLLGVDPGALSDLTLRARSASFGRGAIGRTGYAFEAAINADSLDPAFLSTLPPGATVLACLPDGKDRARMLDALVRLGPVREIALTGAEDYLQFGEAHAAAAIALDKDDAAGLRRLIRETRTFAYLVGTQSFIRLVHRAIALEAQAGTACSD